MQKNIISIVFILIIIMFLTGCIKTVKENSNKNIDNNKSTIIAPDDPESPIKKYFSTKKIVWTFDDYWIHFDYYPPHKGFDGLSQQIHNYGGYVNLMCPFIPGWIGENYGNEIRNYSVVKEFSQYHSGFSQAHINLSLEFFNKSYISAECHGWNHSENLDHANLSFAYKIVNNTLWNWYNNYHIKPHFWLGHNSDGNYNISLALKAFSEKYWTVYAEDFKTDWKDCFPNKIKPAVEYIGDVFDPYFGCTFGHPCKTLQEAQQLFTNYSQDKEIIFIRGHPSFLNEVSHQGDLKLWQDFIDWIYQEHDLININHTQAIEYKIDRNDFRVEKNNEKNYTINLSLCQFNHFVLFSRPNNNTTQWSLKDENWKNLGIIQDGMFYLLERHHIYHFIGSTNTN